MSGLIFFISTLLIIIDFVLIVILARVAAFALSLPEALAPSFRGGEKMRSVILIAIAPLCHALARGSTGVAIRRSFYPASRM
jgi:hypothetical protein